MPLSKAGEGLVVYADVLMVTNLFINYFLLSSAKILLRVQTSRKRILLGALLGSVYALTIFLPKLPTPVSAALNLFASALMVLAAFPLHSKKMFVKAFFAFFAMNFAFAGAMLALWFFFRPNGMIYQNGTVYFDIDIKILVGTTVLCYLLLSVFGRIFRKRAPDNALYDVEITNGGKTVNAKALLDTGHALTDGFTDTPVLVISRRLAKQLAPPNLQPFLDSDITPSLTKDLRLIPYTSVNGEGVLKAFYAQSIRVLQKDYMLQHILLAQSKADFSSTEYEVLLCSDFFERGGTQNVHSKTKNASEKTMAVFAEKRYSLHKRSRDLAGTTVKGRGGDPAQAAVGRRNRRS